MRLIFLFAVSLMFLSCAQKTMTPESQQADSASVRAFFEKAFEDGVQRSPEFQTYLGRKTAYDQLDDLSEEFAQKELAIAQRELATLKKFNYATLSSADQLSYRVFAYQRQQSIDGFKYRYHSYPVNQMWGIQSELPSFMINMHSIANEAEARAYIARLKLFPRQFFATIRRMKAGAELGVIPPRFVFPKVLEDSENVLKGRPFTKAKKDSVLLADFAEKINKLKLMSVTKKILLLEVSEALQTGVAPAYQDLISYLRELEKQADDRVGAWKFSQGAEYYNFQLNKYTTTKMTAEEVHALGLSEVARIHSEMRAIMVKVGYQGTLQEFFRHLTRGKQFYFSSNAQGRQQYLKQTQQVIDDMSKALDGLFLTKPKAALRVKPVEAYREKSAGTAFYENAALDGSRPGTYYVNLYDMANMPKYELEALAYHEAIPGHHMQLSIAQELTGVPTFRKFVWATAYGEGWGLYSELVPKELGFYKDPYADFGRLSMELLRAARLVVDTGLHFKQWTREQAIAYMRENVPSDNTKEVERYIVIPGQATAYKVGMLKILELRERARQALGTGFDIRKFHDVVLTSGALPLDLVEENVMAWIKETESKKN